MKIVDTGGVMNSRYQQGFTLIELMIALAIVAILAALAIPSYKQYVVRAQRKEAQAALQGLGQAMERFYAQNNTYVGTDAGSGVPAMFNDTSPLDGGQAVYNLRITSATATAYSLEAQPITGASQAGDGTVGLTSTGDRTWDKDHNGTVASSEHSWADH